MLLGHFQQDDLEQHFGHFRMSAGCNYYISVRDIANIHSLDRAKQLLSVTEDLDELNLTDVHECNLCKIPLTDSEVLLLDEITEDPRLMECVSPDEKMAMVYIGGYIAYKERSLASLQEDVSCLPENLTAYFNSLNRGKLVCPKEQFIEFLLLAYCFLKQTSKLMCRKRFLFVLKDFCDIFHLDLDLNNSALRRVCNIMMKRFALFQETENIEPKRKLAKLQSTTQKSLGE